MGWSLLSNLSRDSNISTSSCVYIEAHDIIGMMLGRISGLFRLVIDFTTSEECLSIVSFVKNDTEGCSDVDDITIGVIINVLAGILASVAVHIL